MLNCYHTHTSRCHHADGTDEEYVIKAIAEGVRVLGFSDHAPYIYPDGYESYYKMLPSEAAEYFASVRRLAEKYKDKIKLLVGYEAEYYPELWESTLDFWRECGRPDYLILGQHYITEEYIGGAVHSMTGTDDPKMLKRYVDLIIEGADTGRFTYVAHPDCFFFSGDEDFYVSEADRLIKGAMRYGVPLEINAFGLSRARHYPSSRFFERVAKLGADTVIGIDAHTPERVLIEDELRATLDFCERLGIKPKDKIEMRRLS